MMIKQLIKKTIIKHKINSCAKHKEQFKNEYILIDSKQKFDTPLDIEIKTRGQHIIYS